jgi:hypothetical protein
VGAEDARLLDRAHGVDMVEAAARHQFVIRGSMPGAEDIAHRIPSSDRRLPGCTQAGSVLGTMDTQRVAIL